MKTAILSNDLFSMMEDIESVISEVGFDPRDGKTAYPVLEELEQDVCLDIGGPCWVPVEILQIFEDVV